MTLVENSNKEEDDMISNIEQINGNLTKLK
jgi:hypothetical protein